MRSGFETGEQQPLVVLPIDGTPLSVNIVSPTEGATIPTDRLQVYGSLTGPANIGVMVNGELALANASQFSTRPIVLEPGGMRWLPRPGTQLAFDRDTGTGSRAR